MFQVPRDGKLNSVVKARLRRPTELRGNFRRVDCVALVVTFAVGDELNQILTLAENAQNRNWVLYFFISFDTIRVLLTFYIFYNAFSRTNFILRSVCYGNI